MKFVKRKNKIAMENINDNLEIGNVNSNLNNILIMNNGRIMNNGSDATDDFDNDALEVHYLLESSMQ